MIIPIIDITEDGIIRKQNSFLKILEIKPINFALKSDFEKEAILNNYKVLLKTCNFDFQIVVTSSKQNVNDVLEKLKNKIDHTLDDKIVQIYLEHINFLNDLISKKSNTFKKFYVIVEVLLENNSLTEMKRVLNKRVVQLKNCFLNIGNQVCEINSKREGELILGNFAKMNLT